MQTQDLTGTPLLDLAFLIARVMIGLLMTAHGAQKLFGWFGGFGFTGTLQAFSQHMGIPVPLTLLSIAAEFLGPLGL
ncbi:MAG: hypothetical protein B7X11_03085, partial [Acidobacteria bacterium 37-65-4]